MFGFRRLFSQGGARRIGAANGASALFEVMDLNLLAAEAKAAAMAGGLAEGRLAQSRIHREMAIRNGDAISLRRAASSAELATKDAPANIQAEARLEQALCAMDGATLYGHEGLLAAADKVLAELATGQNLVGMRARSKRARIAACQALSRAAPLDALAALTGIDPALTALRSRREAEAGSILTEVRIDRAELTLECARAMDDDRPAAQASSDLAEVLAGLDSVYQPLTWARATRLRAEALVVLGRASGDCAVLSEAVQMITKLFDVLLRDHSPLEWARAQLAHGEALWALAEESGVDEGWSQASGAYDRAWSLLRNMPEVSLRAAAGSRRGQLAIQIAETHADRLEFDAAEAAFRCELTLNAPERDPVGWALSQLNLGRLYLARQRCGLAGDEAKGRAAIAIAAAGEVLQEQGLGNLLTSPDRAIRAI